MIPDKDFAKLPRDAFVARVVSLFSNTSNDVVRLMLRFAGRIL